MFVISNLLSKQSFSIQVIFIMFALKGWYNFCLVLMKLSVFFGTFYKIKMCQTTIVTCLVCFRMHRSHDLMTSRLYAYVKLIKLLWRVTKNIYITIPLDKNHRHHITLHMNPLFSNFLTSTVHSASVISRFCHFYIISSQFETLLAVLRDKN